MNLTNVQTALTTWVETYSGLECEWGRLPQQYHQGAFVLAYAGPIISLGHDEREQSYNDLTDQTSVQLRGSRIFTLRLSFRSFDQNLGSSARQYAENFRVGIHSTTALESLNTAYLALIDTGELVETDYEWSGRMVNQIDMSIRFGLRAYLADPEHDGSYIGTVDIDTERYVIDEYGNPVIDENGDYVTTEATDFTTVP